MAEWAVAGFTELRTLGEGGFGRVVLARHDASGQIVAIKYLYARHLGDAELRAQFRHEAAILRRVISPHVARLYEFIETGAGAAIVMEAVPGVPLHNVLARDPVLPPESALAILKGSLLGLAAAHAAGTVHRDYKPANVLVQPDRQSKLVDFGIAVLAGQSGLASGTPAYMAPEQWRGGTATPATDVYAATCVFFQCVTGHKPYEATDTEQLRELHEHAPVPVDAVPEPVRALVVSGMAKNPAARPPGAAAFVTQLEAAAQVAYGPDWETRGWQRLAADAATLLALSPLAFLASTAGVLLPATGGAMAGGAAGGAGLLGTVAAKVVAVTLGVVVVAGAAVVVITTTGDSGEAAAPPTSTSAPVAQQVKVDVRTRAETAGALTFTGQYAEVSGLGDPALEQRVNEALVAPVNEWYDSVKGAVTDPGQPGNTVTATVEATIHISGPKVLSVEYLQVAGDTTGYYFGADGDGNVEAVTIDLTTGEPLRLTDVFPNTTTPEGAADIATRINNANPQGLCGDQQVSDTLPLELTPESFTGGSAEGVPLAAVVFTPDGAEFVLNLWDFGYPMSCNLQSSKVPYSELADVMSPTATKLLVG